MPHIFTHEEYADIHFVYGYCNGNATAAVTEYQRRFPYRRQPSRNVFIRVHLSLRENGAVYSGKIRYHQGQDRNRNNQILTYFDRNETSSLRRASLNLEIPRETVRRTLRRAHRHPYHFQRVQNLLPQDLRARRNFCEWLLHAVHDDARMLTKILWTDEATFTRTGVVNYHNLHIWRDNNPNAIRPAHFQHEFKVNVWAGILNGILVGPFIFPETLTAASFLDFLENNLYDVLENVPLNFRTQGWIQLDGCPAHHGRQVQEWLNRRYPLRWIGRNGPVLWPPRSPDLTPLDFFLWGTIKDKVYTTVVETRNQLMARIFEAFDEVQHSDFGDNVTAEIILRCESCFDMDGGHFEQLM